MFGRKGLHKQAVNDGPFAAPVDSDGRRRVLGEAVYATHGKMLNQLGFDINDPSNLLPTEADHQRKVQESLARQEERRCRLEAELLARHGVNAIRPFFVFAEAVYNSPMGLWIMRVLDLQPYEEFNLIYLAADEATARATGLPLHPGSSIPPIDETVIAKLTPIYQHYMQRFESMKEKFARTNSFDHEEMDRFSAFKAEVREVVRDYATQLQPLLVKLLADVQQQRA